MTDVSSASALTAGLKIPDAVERILTPDVIPVAIPDGQEIGKRFEGLTRDVEAVSHEINDSVGNLITRTLRWNCDSNKRNRLLVNGAPFRVQELHYSVVDISWQAGDGWPVYTTYCPRGDYHTSMKFPHAKVHQIVPEFGGFYWHGCANPAWARGNTVTEVFFSVNDSAYDDNRGTFAVVVTAWG